MIIRYDKKLVDVAGKGCNDLPCFWLFCDKGSFVPGRGYTSYRDKIYWCCGTRHMQGCPGVGVCLDCRHIITPSEKKDTCSWCQSTNIEIKDSK